MVNQASRLLFCGLTALALLSSGCGKKQESPSASASDGILNRGSGTEPESLDPHVIRGVTEWTIAASLYEGLTAPSPTSDQPSPGVAASWDVSADGLVYTFHIRPDAKWSDGSKLDANDFAYSIERILTPAMGSAHAEDTLLFVVNSRAYQNGELKDFSKVGVKVLDSLTLQLTLENPTPFFLEALYQFYPVKKELVEKFGSMTDRASSWTRPENFVSNGAFRLKSWQTGQALVVEKNPHYWDAAHVRLNGVRFLPFENPSTEEKAFRSDAVHITFGVPLQKIKSYQENNPELIKSAPDYGNYFYSLNVKRPPLDDIRVRKALALAIDRDTLALKILGGGREPALGFSPKGLGDYKIPQGFVRFDPVEARRLLAEAGYPEGKGFRTIEILIDSREPHRPVAEVIKEMWRQNLGIEVRLRNEETRALISSKRLFDFDAVRGSWNATSYRDPHYFLSSWQTGNLYNESGWSNPRYDALIQQAVKTADKTKRLELFAEAEAIMLEEMPVVPLFYSAEIFLMSPKVHGWSPRPFADRLFKALWLE